jgi:3-hydroxybutyrate dehydrogenase
MFITSDNTIVFANPAAVSLLNAASPIDLVGKSILEFTDANFRDLVEEHLRQALEGLDGPLLEEKMLRTDGTAVMVEAIARRINYHGDPAVQVLCRDISTRKHFEAQLLNSQKMEAIARLAGGVANDFNNLLTVITGYSGLIRSGLQPEHPLQKDIQQVIQSTERAIGLTNQLLALSRKEVAAPEALNLNVVLDQMLPLVRRLMGENIETVANIPNVSCHIRADRGQLETVIINLAAHARDSMLNGGQLTLSTENLKLTRALHNQVHLRPGEYILLTIADTGLGLTEEYQEHLFEPFFGTTQPGKNTGLGLATVYAIVKQHGGQISCISEVGKGSVFKIYFPAHKPPQRETTTPPIRTATGGRQPVAYHNADMSKADEIEAMMKFAAEKFGGVDILVNNAGIQHVAPIEDFPVERWDAIIAINLTSAFHTTRLALPGMKQKNWGRIINLASVHGLVGSAQKSAYVAAKHGIVGFTKVTALETAHTGVTCNAICPGWVLTPLVQKQVDDRAARDGLSNDAARKALLAEKQPSGEFVTPEELGALAVFFCSPAGDQVRGVAWNMDGGWAAQ